MSSMLGSPLSDFVYFRVGFCTRDQQFDDRSENLKTPVFNMAFYDILFQQKSSAVSLRGTASGILEWAYVQHPVYKDYDNDERTDP